MPSLLSTARRAAAKFERGDGKKVEARATIKETSVSRTFLAAVLMLIAMGLGAMGGYVAQGARATSGGPAHISAVQSVQQQPATNESPTQLAKNGIHGDHGNLP